MSKTLFKQTAMISALGGSGGGSAGTCKFKLIIDDGEYTNGELALVDDKGTVIYFHETYGTTLNYEIPCGCAMVLKCDYPPVVENLTKVYGSEFIIYQAPSEPGAECSLRIKFDW